MGTSAKTRSSRQKISTTIAPETLSYLERLIRTGAASTLAEAVDLLVERLRQAENRERLEHDTAAYFESLPSRAVDEESELTVALAAGTRGINFDREP